MVFFRLGVGVGIVIGRLRGFSFFYYSVGVFVFCVGCSV